MEKIKYKKFISYFERNWRNCNFLNFEKLEQVEIDERTDNQCEIFHRKLNQLINKPHPKVSKSVEKLKEYSIERINLLAENLILNTENNKKEINIYKDIFKFVKTIKEKYNKVLSLDLLNSLEKEEKEKVKDISISIIKEIMNVELDDKLNENSDNIELCSEDDSSENLEDLKIKDEENKSEIEEELEDEPNNNSLFDYGDKKKKFIKKGKNRFL